MSKVRNARDRRSKVKEKAGNIPYNKRNNSDANRTRHAISGYSKSGLSLLDSDQKEARQKAQHAQSYMGLGKFTGLNAYLARRTNAMKKGERYTLADRMELKKERIIENARRRDRGMKIPHED